MNRRITRIIKIAMIAIVAAVALSFVVMSLWNWLAPTVFGGKTITMVQAFGLLVLSKILFGGFHGHGRSHWRRRMHERWEQMTPEEREKFRQGMRCGGSRAAEGLDNAEHA